MPLHSATAEKDDAVAAICRLKKNCQQSHTRGLAIVAGSLDWGTDCVSKFAAAALSVQVADPAAVISWIADDLPGQLAQPQQFRHIHQRQVQALLGNDSGNIVVNCFDGFNPNTLAIASGTVVGGGILILIVPPLAEWPEYDDPDYLRYNSVRPASLIGKEKPNSYFIQRIIHRLETLLHDDQLVCSIVLLQQLREAKNKFNRLATNIAGDPINAAVNDLDRVNVAKVENYAVKASALAPAQLNSCQRKLIDNVVSCMAREATILIVRAGRGRGKSTALGFAANRIISESPTKKIIITAPSITHVNNFYTALRNVRMLGAAAQSALADLTQQVIFLAADQLLMEQTEADLLIVDEAAAFPVPVLHQLSRRFKRIVLATTNSGYEGSGRGFDLRFLASLSESPRDVKQQSLDTPVRWSPQCRLEHTIADLLAISGSDIASEPGSLPPESATSAAQTATDNILYRKLEQRELLQREDLLRQLFILLAQAHYQTQPNDLRMLLDMPFIHLWLAETVANSSGVVAGLLVIEEGAFEPSQRDLAQAIASGKRRPKGNLVAQKLAFESGRWEWLSQKGLRIVRIAVHENWRRAGVASRLIDQFETFAKKNHCDYWSSSFGFDPTLQAFWRRQNTFPLHLGMHLDKSSGARNLIVCRSFSEANLELSHSLVSRLADDLPLLWPRWLQAIDSPTVEALLAWAAINPINSQSQRADDASRLLRYQRGELSLASAFGALTRLVSHQAPAGVKVVYDLSRLDMDSSKFLRLLIVNAPDWSSISRNANVTGRSGIDAKLRQILADASI